MEDAERGFSQSLWRHSAGKEPKYPVLAENLAADVVIVGGGFTGLSCALHLVEYGKSVVLLEARDIGWGASGRNGGQVNPGAKLLPSKINSQYGLRRGEEILKLLNGTCDQVFDLITRHDIDCAPRRAPYFRAAFGVRGRTEVENWAQEWGALGAPVELKNRTETNDLMGSSFFDGGVEDARGGSLNPLMYARGLANSATKAGARLFVQSKVTRIERDKKYWSLTTEKNARINAPVLILATNGYTDDLWPGLNKQIVPVASLQAATKKLPQKILRTILPYGHHFSDTRRMMVYCRLDETGRFLIGGKGNPFSPAVQQADTRHLQAEACAIFPQLKSVEWEFEWGGLVGMTQTHMPSLIRLDENAYAGLGYNGRGIAMGTVMGKQLAGLVAGEDVCMPIETISPFILHEFRNIGIGWQMITGQLRDKIEKK